MYIDFFVILGSHLVLKAIKAMIADDCDEVSNTKKPLSLGKMGHIIKIWIWYCTIENGMVFFLAKMD